MRKTFIIHWGDGSFSHGLLWSGVIAVVGVESTGSEVTVGGRVVGTVGLVGVESTGSSSGMVFSLINRFKSALCSFRISSVQS